MPRWTRKASSHFIDALRRGRNVTQAAETSGMSRMSAYRRRARDPRFARTWDAARAHAAEVRLDNIRQTRVRSLALNGRAVDCAATGEIRDRLDAKSNTALLALLHRLDRFCASSPLTYAAPATPQFPVNSAQQSRHSL